MVDLLKLREAIENSWDDQTSYLGVKQKGNPALGQCYPTSRIVQHFFPDTEILKGIVMNNGKEETHFWNVLIVNGTPYHIDFSWSQFSAGASVLSYYELDRTDFNDGVEGKRRVALLLDKVTKYLKL